MHNGAQNHRAVHYAGALVMSAMCLPAIVGCTGKPVPPVPYEPTWESVAEHEAAPDWFRDAKFGIYLHWGVYSVPAFGSEWYPRQMHILDTPEFHHHRETYGDPTEFGYHDFVPMFTAEHFDADEWAALFQQAGARFAGPVAEHHDGFAMWDSELTPWNAADRGPKRDIVGELEEAIRTRGMRFITSFHHARNNLWEHQNDRDGVWNGHYAPVKQNFPSLLEDPEWAILYGYLPREQFLQMWQGKLIEVVDRYQPDLMWFDFALDEIADSVQTAYLAHYFNQAQTWGRDVVVTSKHEDLPLAVGVEDFEKGRTDRLTEHPWLTDDTISRGSWCYTEGLEIKDTEEVLHTLIDIVSKNGQLLLNISPRADGTIPENQQTVLLEIGDWLRRFGEAIYETRPFVDYGEGPTRMEEGGHFLPSIDYTPQDIRYTRNGDTVYAILLGWPGAGEEVVMSILGVGQQAAGVEVTGVSLLGGGMPVRWERQSRGLVVTTPDEQPDERAVVFVLRTSGV